MKRFPSSGQYCSYCRLVPGAANSGGKSRHRSSKQGNRYLKAIYTEAAVRAAQWYPVVREFYGKKTRRSGKRIARAIVAKELAKIVWHMLYPTPTSLYGMERGEVEYISIFIIQHSKLPITSPFNVLC